MGIKSRHILVLIILLAAIIRCFRMADLAVFLADQASDATNVWGILQGDFTLLGPVTSVGGFYNGPIVYYLMLPFYAMFGGDPIAGPVFQTLFQLATIPLMYLIGKRMRSDCAGLIASFLFAASPLMVEYSRAAFNAFPAIFFSTLIIYLLLRLTSPKQHVIILITGIAIGWIVQMHYLTIVFLVLAVLVPFVIQNRLRSITYYSLLLCGFLLGLSPFLLFELKHAFLNTHLLIRYLQSPPESVRSFTSAFTIWPAVTGQLLFGNQVLLGALGFVVLMGTTIRSFIKQHAQSASISLLLLLFLIVFAMSLFYGNTLQPHYVIAFHTSLLLLAGVTIDRVSRDSRVILAICLGFFVLNMFHWKLDVPKHPIQDGLHIADFRYAAQLIDGDAKGVYNVGMHAQGDNRAMPLRYLLLRENEHPESYERYGDIEHLYFIVRNNEPITRLRMWEYTAFGPSQVLDRWQVNDEYFLYKLGKLPN